MDRYELLRSISKHAAQHEAVATFAVAYLAADVHTDVLQRLLDAIHELETPETAELALALYAERYGRRPDSTR